MDVGTANEREMVRSGGYSKRERERERENLICSFDRCGGVERDCRNGAQPVVERPQSNLFLTRTPTEARDGWKRDAMNLAQISDCRRRGEAETP